MSWNAWIRPGRLPAGGAFAALWVVAGRAQAADAWPATSPEWLARDSGGGLAVVPLVCWWALVAAWAATSSWVFGDAGRFKVRPVVWTNCVVFPFVVFALAAWWIPWAVAGQALMVLAWIVPLALYARERNPKAPPSESILTIGHLIRVSKAGARKVGIKVADDAQVFDSLPWVRLLVPPAATPDETQKRQDELAKTPGFETATKILQEAAAARATTVVIEPTADGVRVGYEVDGIPAAARAMKTAARGRGQSRQPEVWADAPPIESASGNAAVGILRTIAGTDAAGASMEKGAAFTIEVDGKKRNCRLSMRATKTTKQVVVAIDLPPFAPKKLEDLGMATDLANRVRDLIALEKGLFIVSSPPASGCTTTFDTVLLTADRLLRDFVSIEDADAPAKEIQNVKPIRFARSNGETGATALKQAMLEYPRAIVTRDLVEKELAVNLMELADDQQFVLVSLEAPDAIAAIQRLIAMGISRDQIGRCLLGSLCQRLVRKVCSKCGDKVPSPPDLLKRVKMTAEEVPHIKRISPHGGCRFCSGRLFIGRTAIFELAAGPALRQAIARSSDPKELRAAAIKDGMRSLTDTGMAMVAAGDSTLDEMQRVFAVKKEAGAVPARK